MSARHRYSQSFKDEAVALVITSGRPVAQVAADISVHEGTLGNWVRKYRREHPEQFPCQENEAVDRATHSKIVADNARLRQENEFLHKSQRLLRSAPTVEDIYRFIEAEQENYKVAMMCRAFKVSRASFYRWRAPSLPSKRAQRHAALATLIQARFAESQGRVGRDKLTRILHEEGIKVSVTTVGAIMRELGLRSGNQDVSAEDKGS